MNNIVITVARGFGSGGKEIASRVAKDLGISCYENRILTLASQLSGLDQELFNEVNEKIREKGGFSAFMKGLPRARSYITKGKFVSDDALFEYQKKIILDLAETQSCVIVGKCADWILRGRDNVIIRAVLIGSYDVLFRHRFVYLHMLHQGQLLDEPHQLRPYAKQRKGRHRAVRSAY